MKLSLGPLSIVGIIFVICKAFVIGPIAAWSWFWVLSPFWFIFALVGVLALFALIVALLTEWSHA